MRKLMLCLVGFCMVLPAPRAHADDFQVDLDVSYSVSNPDYFAFENGEGISIYGEASYDDSWMLVGRHNDAAFRPSGPVAGGIVESWSEIGLGYRIRWSAAWASELIISSQHVDNTRGSESGFLVQVGARFEALDTLSLALHVGYLDVLIEDWTINIESKYQLHRHIYAVARLRDYGDWDLTYYELGLGLRF